MDFPAFNISKLQGIIAFLDQCESGGITDIRFARERAHDYIRRCNLEERMTDYAKDYARQKQKDMRIRNMARQKRKTICPECGSGRWERLFAQEDLILFDQCNKCGFSEILQEL